MAEDLAAEMAGHFALDVQRDFWKARWEADHTALEEARELLRQNVKLLRTVYRSKADFAHEAQMVVIANEAWLSTYRSETQE